MSLSEQNRALDLRALKNRLQNLDRRGGLGYEAHEIVRDTINTLDAIARAEGVAALQQAGELFAENAKKSEQAGEPVACPKCAGAEIVAAGNGQYDDCSCATEEPPRSWFCLPGEDPVEFDAMVAECRAAGEREVLCEEIAEALFKVDEKHGPFRLNIPYSALRSFQKSQYERYAEAVAAYLDKAAALSPLPQQTALVEQGVEKIIAQHEPAACGASAPSEAPKSDGWPNLGNPPDPEWLAELIRALGAVPLHNEHIHINFNGEIVKAGRVIKIAQRQLARLSPAPPPTDGEKP